MFLGIDIGTSGIATAAAYGIFGSLDANDLFHGHVGGNDVVAEASSPRSRELRRLVLPLRSFSFVGS